MPAHIFLKSLKLCFAVKLTLIQSSDPPNLSQSRNGCSKSLTNLPVIGLETEKKTGLDPRHFHSYLILEWRGNVGTHPCGVRKNQERCGKWLLESNEKSWPKTFCGCAPQVFFRTVSPTPKRFSPVIALLARNSIPNAVPSSQTLESRLRDMTYPRRREQSQCTASDVLTHAPCATATCQANPARAWKRRRDTRPHARVRGGARDQRTATPIRAAAVSAPRLVVCGRGRGVSCRAGKQG